MPRNSWKTWSSTKPWRISISSSRSPITKIVTRKKRSQPERWLRTSPISPSKDSRNLAMRSSIRFSVSPLKESRREGLKRASKISLKMEDQETTKITTREIEVARIIKITRARINRRRLVTMILRTRMVSIERCLSRPRSEHNYKLLYCF